jgi:hypothetical protein
MSSPLHPRRSSSPRPPSSMLHQRPRSHDRLRQLPPGTIVPTRRVTIPMSSTALAAGVRSPRHPPISRRRAHRSHGPEWGVLACTFQESGFPVSVYSVFPQDTGKSGSIEVQKMRCAQHRFLSCRGGAEKHHGATSNKPFQASSSTWLLCRLFLDTSHSASLLPETQAASRRRRAGGLRTLVVQPGPGVTRGAAPAAGGTPPSAARTN